MLYFVILIYIIILSIKFPKINRIGSFNYWVLCSVFILVAGFRYNVGVDTYTYGLEYENFPTLSELDYNFVLNSNYKFFWILFESSIRSISNSFYLLQFLLAFFVNIIVFRFCKIYSLNPFLTILLYYLLFYLNLNMEILRESVSMSLMLLCLEMWINKRYIYFFLLSIIAYFFHESALIILLIPFLKYFDLNKTGVIVTLFIAIVFSSLISSYFVDILTFQNLILNGNKVGYLESLSVSDGTNIFILGKYVFFPTAVLLFLFSYLSIYEKVFILLYVISSILYIELFIFYRIRDYFLLLFLVAFVNGVSLKFNLEYSSLFFKKAVICCFIFISLFRYYYNSKMVNDFQVYYNYYPYKSILDEEIPSNRMNNIRYLGK
jgi:hypothetical protein